MNAVGLHVFAGGFAIGINRAGFECTTFLEEHALGRETLKLNWPKAKVIGSKSEWPEYLDTDLLFGNPRCSAFSQLTSGYDAGTHGAEAASCADWWDCVRMTNQYKPRAFIFESVQAFGKHGGSFINAFKGYHVSLHYLNTKALGNPQNRRRLFVVGLRDRMCVPELPERVPYRTIGDVILDLEDVQPTSRHIDKIRLKELGRHSFEHGGVLTCNHYNFDLARRYPHDMQEIFEKLPQGGSVRKFHHLLSASNVFGVEVQMKVIMHGFRRLHVDGPCPTIYSGSHVLVHPTCPRGITAREGARLMGFPDSYRFVDEGKSTMAQVGKGVVVDAGKWVGSTMARALHGEGGDERSWRIRHREVQRMEGTGVFDIGEGL